jgi:ribosomal protein L19
LQQEELQNLINGRIYPDIEPGDSISIDILPYSTSKTTENIKGVVIGISKNGCDTLIKMLNVSHPLVC